MTSRRFKEKVQKDYLRHVRNFAIVLGRSPDAATAEDVRLYQLHLAEQKIGAPSINAAVAALRFLGRTSSSIGAEIADNWRLMQKKSGQNSSR
jgi:hypothetical protein